MANDAKGGTCYMTLAQIIFNIILFAFGIVSVLFPRLIWKIKSIWRYDKTEEPSNFLLMTIRIVGVVILAIFVIGYLR